jgi:hypothetical protein
MNSWSRLATVGVSVSPLSHANPRLKKPLILTGVFLAVVLFGDKLLPVLVHGIILFLEILEALSDHILESVFGLSPWTAQLITAWTGFFIFVALFAFALVRIRRAYQVMKGRFATWLDRVHG